MPAGKSELWIHQMTKSDLGQRELEVGANIKGKEWLQSLIPERSRDGSGLAGFGTAWAPEPRLSKGMKIPN